MLLHLQQLPGTLDNPCMGHKHSASVSHLVVCVERLALVFAHKCYQCPVFSVGSRQGGSAVLGSVWLPAHMIYMI